MELNLPEMSLKDTLAAQPLARAMIFRQLNQIWASCEPHLDPDNPKPDVRQKQIALQVTKQMAELFLLDKLREDEESAAPVDVRERDTATIEATLLELEARDSRGE